MKKFLLAIVISFLGVIFINFVVDEEGNKRTNINKEINGKNKPTFTIPKGSNKIYDQHTLLVKFKPGVTRIQRNTLGEFIGAKFKDKNNDGIDDRYRSILGGRLVLLELEGNKQIDYAAAALAMLKNHPNVEYAEFNYRQSINVIPNDSFINKQWAMNNTGQTGGIFNADIDAPETWDIATGNSEVIVGVIDTGVDYKHEDLAANIWLNPNEVPNNNIDDDGNGYIDDIHGIDAIIENGDPWDDHSHGTHVSGIIGAVGNNRRGVAGVNWAVKIIGLKFLDSDGYGWLSDAIECIDYAIWLKNHGINIKVLNNSWAGGGSSQTLADAIKEVDSAGILFTAPAGNDVNDNDSNPTYPACYPKVLAVAATDSNDGLSWFSNYGATTVHLGAPGSEILSTIPNNNYSSFTGTSMAAPHVSGAAALLLSRNDRLTVQEIKDNLMNYGDPLPALDGKTVSGRRLNLYHSMVQVPPPPPHFTLSVTPAFRVIEQGQSVSYTVRIQTISGYASPVSLTALIKPAFDGTIVFSPNPAPPDSTSLMTINTANTTAETDYIINITGTGGSLVKTAAVLFKITPVGMVTLSYTNDTIRSIPDENPQGVTGIINIPDALKIWEASVNVNITHPSINELVVKLISPQGTEVILHNMEGGFTGNIHKTYHIPQCKNEGSRGNWRLVAADLQPYSTGTLDSWTLIISGVPENPMIPQADFMGAPTIISVGRSVKFTDTSANYPTSRLWTFNGGSPSDSTLSNPQVTYNTPGTYDVSLSISNPQGSDSITKAGYITVVPYQPPPVAGFSTSATSIMEGKQITFTDKSTKAPVSWSWSFPGGEPSTSNQQNPRVTYNTMGVYDVSLTVSNPGGEDTKTKKGYIQVNKLAKRIGLFDFSSVQDCALVFDYNGDRIDDLFLYRPGTGTACVVRSNGDGTFDNVYYADGISKTGIGLYDLRSVNDQVLKFDYNGDGNDDLFLYRPGTGAVGIVRSNGNGTFTSVYNVVDNGSASPNGINGYSFLSTKDRALAFQLNGNNYEDLLFYRPSRGAVTVLDSMGDGTFKTFYSVIDNGADIPNGIYWFDLLSAYDRAIAFNCDGYANDELLFYRPGRGAVGVFSSNWDGTFRSVYSVIDNGPAFPNGIGGYDLLSTKDQVLACDYNGDGFKDLLCYRPGRGAVGIIRSNLDGTFSNVYQVIDNGSAPPNGICGFDLLSANDMAVVFDYNGDGYDDICFYRPGRGSIDIICSNTDETFTSVYSVIDNGSTNPNGIGGYNLLSSNDRVLAYDFDGDGSDGLFLYRPGGNLVGFIPCVK